MSQLFTPLQLRDIILGNRIVVSPMCQYSANDGMSNDWHLVHLGSRAVGGAGLVFTEATAVSPAGRISPHDLGIWKDEHIEGLRRIVKFVRAQGSEIGIQLAHAGRKASVREPWNGGGVVNEDEGGWPVLAPSPVAYDGHYGQPVELTTTGIREVVSQFKAAARRAMLAGFKVVEIHAAHGYLIHQFLSPLSNRRHDEYGGSFENRTRLLMEIVDAVRSGWPPGYPLFVRISATDWAAGGWSVEDAVRLAGMLKERGVDVIDCSSGGLVPYQKIPAGPGYQVEFSQKIRMATGILTGAVGIITDAVQAETLIVTGQADLVFLARQLLRDPYFPLHAAAELRHAAIHWPLQYERAKPL
ncbi:NADPH dehydrogenase NamA [Puia dinghuensis]|uniref:Oxidoreductase n=1 Tax=Puia dinghuensis TaxID=1792502 RepID=A0A8J2UBA3_9BACT|nr:NADPH dehydrogenase NamA [Puia dinghuensis]GGA91819.1 oxidoreductase [Puia dinghuensis]